ncbi:Uncharacterised protein [Mycobacterium tuberculosis]|uniref:Uncharacterized protein n=1 Tax=Mycobacterium tuberculosis TaxID=1773 RepID=A0A654TW07_MYCTX|nr:Uncharacterised protein [Mycobacterium tuberculosis]CKQ41822.1 Uncharacterised protein [Mycobacterium tuberculosis]CKR83051.1 Uncharacterised protein [Mycobacterium tuberculosis]CKS86923.1 Uncharacterised protein [Mycobacterium tuberculosis]CKT41195.1 Uncharacterised protein [Mycobacterium tuberculosis]
MPPSTGVSVMVTVDPPGGGSPWSSQPQVKTTRLPGSTSMTVPAALCPGVTVQR